MQVQALRSQNRDDPAALRRECGHWLKEKREALGLSQRELANLVGIEYYTFISQIESGRGRVPPERFEAYATALKVAPRDFTMEMLRFNEPAIYRLLTAEDDKPVAKQSEGSVVADLERRLMLLESILVK